MGISSKGTIFAIKRFALHDGPGIRTTVFLKGCPLRCLWCHNPEGLSPDPQLAFYPHLCIGCGQCYEVCPSGAIRKESSPIANSSPRTGENHNREKCTFCGKCAEVCPAGAIELIGIELSADDVIERVLRDGRFYETSGGGLTVSGGEPLAQPDFAVELLAKAHALGIHTVLDTSGFARAEDLDRCLEHTDHVYYDLKIADERRHRNFTGLSNRLILDNLRRVGASGILLTIRIPLVKGLNDSPEDIRAFADFIASLPSLTNLQRVEIIPYHRIGEGKYRSVGLDYPLKSQPVHTRGEVSALMESFARAGLTVYCSSLTPPAMRC